MKAIMGFLFGVLIFISPVVLQAAPLSASDDMPQELLRYLKKHIPEYSIFRSEKGDFNFDSNEDYAFILNGWDNQGVIVVINSFSKEPGQVKYDLFYCGQVSRMDSESIQFDGKSLVYSNDERIHKTMFWSQQEQRYKTIQKRST